MDGRGLVRRDQGLLALSVQLPICGHDHRQCREESHLPWMRVHLMGDPELRSWFYGASCKLCTDSAWQITQKNMDQ
jgi:hypothetical protein